ncbi:MAG: hypothetical protein AAFP09_01020 [Cyanobacteria bacterium J06607_10]
MGKTNKEKLDDFIGSIIESVLALLSLGVDALFWLGWGYITSWSGQWVNSLEVTGVAALPYKISQFCGCGVLLMFVSFKTGKDAITLWDNFNAFLDDRTNETGGD